MVTVSNFQMDPTNGTIAKIEYFPGTLSGETRPVSFLRRKSVEYI